MAGEGRGLCVLTATSGPPPLTLQPRHPLTHLAVHKPRHPVLELMAINICVCGLFFLNLGFP